jgi:hypothetical protein
MSTRISTTTGSPISSTTRRSSRRSRRGADRTVNDEAPRRRGLVHS